MRAAILEGVRTIVLREVEKPKLQPGEVLVRVRSVGVCGSDVHYFTHGRVGSYVVDQPLILGHECAGDVVELGPDVRSLKLGDRVAIEPGVPCRQCPPCKEGRYNLCPDVRFMATPPIDGAFAEFVSTPEDFAYRLPDHVSYDEGALIEPLAVAVYTMERSCVVPGDKVAILGAGPIGLLLLQAARAYGASVVAITDASQFRLSKARELGANIALDVSTEDTVAGILDYMGSEADVVIEASGNPGAVAQTWQLAKRGGKIAVVGIPPDPMVGFDFGELSRKELDVVGIFRYANVYKKAIQLVSEGRITLNALVTHRFSLDCVQSALEAADKYKDTVVKAIVDPSS